MRAAGIFLVTMLFVAGCDVGGRVTVGPPPEPQAHVPHDALFDVLAERPSRNFTTFFGDNLWAIDYSDRLIRSTDGGRHWEVADLPAAGPVYHAQFEKDGQLGIVVNEDRIMMRTENGGASWTTYDFKNLLPEDVDLEYYLDGEPAFDESLTNGVWREACQIYRTADGGETWTRHGDGLQDEGDEWRCVGEARWYADSGTWFAEVEITGRILTSGDYLYRSNDDGESWEEICSLDEVGLLLESILSCYRMEDIDEPMQQFLGEYFPDINFERTELQEQFRMDLDHGVFVERSLVIPDPLKARLEDNGLIADRTMDRIWRDDDGDRLAYTEDGGKSWVVVNGGLPDWETLDFTLGTDRGFGIYEYGHLALTADLGRTWQILNDEPLSIYDLIVLPGPGRVLLATDEGLYAIDTDTLEWRQVGSLNEFENLVVAGDVVWAFSVHEEIYRSTDAGLSWIKLPHDPMQVDFYTDEADCNAERCLLDGYQSIARVSAEPFSFEVTDLSKAIPGFTDAYVGETILDVERNRAWLIVNEEMIHGSIDGGRTWQNLGTLAYGIDSFTAAPGFGGFIASGYTTSYLWSRDGRTFEQRQVPGSDDAYLQNHCWLNDSTVLLDVYDEETGKTAYFASLDAGYTWGPTDELWFGSECVMPGGLAMLYSKIALVRP